MLTPVYVWETSEEEHINQKKKWEGKKTDNEPELNHLTLVKTNENQKAKKKKKLHSRLFL